MKSFLAALQFLTIIPIPKGIKIEEKDLAGSVIFFPLVGLFIGGILMLIAISLRKFLPILTLNLLLLLVWIGITSALHLDGLADTVDGLSGGKDKEEILRIMADSNIGAKGAIALILLLGAKYLFLYQLPFTLRNHALLLVPALGRWAMVLAAAFLPYAKEEGLGRIFVENSGRREILLTSLLITVLGLLLIKFSFFYLLGGLLSATFLLLVIFKGRIGGITGDNLGAINEIVEVVALLIIILGNSS
ncbi:MAG: adenosylcobinamide-GDP ribazoletransferase [Candidatus Omnitrophica bacterium]|nr:adenosylcobinamide-GDP ribazoletransferase [Candidatus Omnitrophota bacterium]